VLIATLQCRTIIVRLLVGGITAVVAARAGTFVALVGIRGGAAQRRTIFVFLGVVELMAIFKQRQPRFHVVKLGSRNHILRPGGKNLVDLFLALLDAIGRLRVRRKCFRQGS